MNRGQVSARFLARRNEQALPEQNDGVRRLRDGTVIESITFPSRKERHVPQGEVRGIDSNGVKFSIAIPLSDITNP